MLVGELDEVTYELEVDGELVRRELGRKVWERGAWATVAIAFTERGEDGWKPAKLVVIRLQRVREAWKKHALITLRGDEAAALGDAIAGWREALASDDPGDD